MSVMLVSSLRLSIEFVDGRSERSLIDRLMQLNHQDRVLRYPRIACMAVLTPCPMGHLGQDKIVTKIVTRLASHRPYFSATLRRFVCVIFLYIW